MSVLPIAKIVTLSSILFAGLANADCNRPDAPSLPDGSSATKEQMIDGQKAIKAYMAGTNEYLDCLNQEEKTSVETDTEETKAARLQAYNTAVSDMENVAAAFNGEIKKWKAQGAK